MNNFRSIENQLDRAYLRPVAAKGEILGLIAADAYLACRRFFQSLHAH